MPLTIATWNLKGSKGLDVTAVAAHLRAVGADIVALQEVQRHQARALGLALDARSVRWGFKHWPVRTWPEGMAVIGVSFAARVRTRALSARWRPWSSRRRVFQLATFAPDVSGEGATPLVLANVHLSTRRNEQRRAGEVTAVLAAVRSGPGLPVVIGDFNERPGGAIFEGFAAAGLRDAWDDVRPGVPEAEKTTYWPRWKAGTSAAPSQRLDYLMIPAAVTVAGVVVPRPGDEGFARFATLSDHLPLAATLDVATGAPEAPGAPGPA
ncbi:MAG TPA: endonuclease/exonuclease/phosphatase family protein [Acidimicrobiales bacterium]|nr:endonuclease/exonuclease/phosphatase family protein [Acidimicrobiales bacterium]